MAKRSAVIAEVDGRQLELSNLDKVLYPSGFTKGEVIDYCARIAPVTVPHLRGRALTFRRFPNGTEATGLLREALPGPPARVGARSRSGPATATAASSTAASRSRPRWCGPGTWRRIELHAPMALAADLDTPRAVVFDFDPGPRTDITDCCAIALEVRDVLGAVDLEGWCKTSGSKGLQLYVPLNTDGVTHERRRRVRPRRRPGAREAAAQAGHDGDGQGRRGRGRSSSTGARTPTTRRRSPRTRCGPDRSRRCRRRCRGTRSRRAAGGELELRFEAADVLERVDEHGDLFEPVLTVQQRLPG